VNTKKDFFINIVMIAIITPFGEEFLFRGILQKLLINATKRKHLSIIIASFIFGFFHFQFFTFLPRFLMGILFGYLLLWSKSLWLPICCHFVNNASAVIFSFLSNKKYIPSNIDDVGKQQNQILIIFISIIIVAFLIYAVYRTEKKNTIKFISI
ncbi:MAG: CPBP family intramembrane metalloprotease, partial [Bacteroidales bacterium]|nr:CPBP family intramembrane metalloprotease [Bacteroidales bacterium]